MNQVHEANMRVSNSSILIVSQVNSCIGYENILRRNNFKNIYNCKDGVSALQQMENETPLVLVVDSDLPDMDGFELASNVRDIERGESRFTYIILVTDDVFPGQTEYSGQANVDAIVSRRDLPFRLIPQTMSGERIACQINHLLEENTTLASRCGYLEAGQLLDPLTGLGNRRQAMKGMEDMIRQVEARGGAVALLLIKVMDYEQLVAQHGQEIMDEMIISMGHKVRRLVRPLDISTYFDRGVFGIIMQHESLDHCKADSYTRIHQGLALKSFQTRAGFLQPTIAIGACGAGAETGPPKTSSLVAMAMSNLKDDTSGEVKVSVLNPL